MTAHTQIADVVKEYDPGAASRINRIAQQSTDHGIGAPRLVDDGGAERIKLAAKSLQAQSQCASTEVGATLHDDASGFATGMRVDHMDLHHSSWYSAGDP